MHIEVLHIHINKKRERNQKPPTARVVLGRRLLHLLANSYRLRSTLSGCLWVGGRWVLRCLASFMFPILTLEGAPTKPPYEQLLAGVVGGAASVLVVVGF